MIEEISVIGMSMSTVLAAMTPIIAIVAVFWIIAIKTKERTRLRESMVNANTDPELAKVLLTKEKSPASRTGGTGGLRWACALLGFGLGAFTCWVTGCNNADSIYFWGMLVAGIGLGLLVSFIIEWQLVNSKKEAIDLSLPQTQTEEKPAETSEEEK